MILLSLAENIPNDHHLAGWGIIQSSYRGNARYFLVQGRAVFKKIRVEGGIIQFVEMVNELICNSLGKRIGIPLVNTFLGILPQEGIGLFSILLGEQPYNPTDQGLKSQIQNHNKLKDLFVFDQWIFNDDRRADHIMIGEEPTKPGKRLLYAYDHGHTLNGYQGQKWTLETLTDEILKSIGQVLFDSEINSYAELSDVISRIKSVSDKEIDTVIEHSIGTILQFNLKQEDMRRINNNAQVINRLLKSRRENIEKSSKSGVIIMENLYRKANIHCFGSYFPIFIR